MGKETIIQKNQPLVSIITPCYNGENFVHRYFESILKQTYSNIEIIFINDGSTDKTEKIALDYKKKIEEKGYSFHYIYQENAGQAAAVNKGLKIFTGEYLTWPDSDDWMSDDYIEKMARFLMQNQQFGMVLCKTAVVEADNIEVVKEYYYRKNIEKHYIFDDLIAEKDAATNYPPGKWMIRTNMFLDVLPSRHIYEGRGGQNYQMLLPIAYKYKCGFIDNTVYYYLIRKDSHSHNKKSYDKKIKLLYLYEDVKKNAILSIDMDKKERNKLVRDQVIYFSKRRFFLALEKSDKVVLKREYRTLKKEKVLDKGMKYAYLECNHKILFYVQCLFTNPKRLFKDIRQKLK